MSPWSDQRPAPALLMLEDGELFRGEAFGAPGISSEPRDPDELLAVVRRSPGMAGADLAREVTTDEAYDVAGPDPRFRVVAYDFGIKRNILRLLTAAGCAVRVVPATTPAERVLEEEPDGVFCSNG